MLHFFTDFTFLFDNKKMRGSLKMSLKAVYVSLGKFLSVNLVFSLSASPQTIALLQKELLI